jgi:hypothetical protein
MEYVYFAQVADFVKIGCSIHPEKRLPYIGNTYGAPPIVNPRLLGFFPGVRGLESLIHSYFKPFRIDGEWFEAAKDAIERIHVLLRFAGAERPNMWDWQEELAKHRIERPHTIRWLRLSQSPIGYALTKEALINGQIIGATLFKSEGRKTGITLVCGRSLDEFIERLVLSEMERKSSPEAS